MSNAFPSKTATQEGAANVDVLSVAVPPNGKASIKPSATITGQNGNYRKFKFVELDSNGALVQVLAQISFTQGINAPAGVETQMQFLAPNLPTLGNTIAILSTVVGSGMASPSCDLVIAYEE